MQTLEYVGVILQELHRTVETVSEAAVEQLVERILDSKKIFVAGVGRSGLMARSFAMRMMHMGLDPYVVGETVTAGIEEGDLLILSSGSGETKGLVPMAEKAKSLGASVAVVTIKPASTLGKLADLTVEIAAKVKDEGDSGNKSIQPMGSLFEQTMLVMYDAVILRLMEKKGMTSETMFGRHANLE